MNKVGEKEIKLIIKSVILIIFVALILIFYNIFIKDDGVNASDKYMVVGNYLILQKTNTSWKQIKKFNDNLKDLTYTITDGTSTYDNITLQKSENNDWYFLDSDYNQIKMKDFKVATHNLDVKVADYKYEYVDDLNSDIYIKQVAKENNLSLDTYNAEKMTYDIDKDGNDEIIYALNNSSLTSVDYDVYGVLFLVDEGVITVLNMVENEPLLLMEILDIDSDGLYEIIVSKGVLNLPTFGSCYLIYGKVNEKLELEKDC